MGYNRAMIDLDLKDIDDLENELKTFAKRSYPFATKQALNATAWGARKQAQRIIGERFIERNKWTRGSIRVEQARKHGVPIPTAYAAGQEGQQPRTKVPRRPNRLSSIKFNRSRARGKTRKQRILLSVREAVQTGRRFRFIDFGGDKSKGIMRVLGGRKGTKKGWPKGARLKMVYSLKDRAVRIPKTPWLDPAVEAEMPRMREHFRQALIFQLRRQKLGVS
jgi:hypothetical protein